MTTIFAKIIRGEIPAKKVYEDDRVLAFDDVGPQAPVHVLIVPKDSLVNLNDADEKHEALLGHMLVVARKVAALKGVDATGWRLVVNNGAEAGQSVFHLHMHVLGGRGFTWPPG